MSLDFTELLHGVTEFLEQEQSVFCRYKKVERVFNILTSPSETFPSRKTSNLTFRSSE